MDELNLLVHPIVVGTGQRLFEDNGAEVPLKLASYKAFSTGVAHLVCHNAWDHSARAPGLLACRA